MVCYRWTADYAPFVEFLFVERGACLFGVERVSGCVEVELSRVLVRTLEYDIQQGLWTTIYTDES